MVRKTRVVRQGQVPVKHATMPPAGLTQDEITRLLQVFLHGKVEVLDADLHVLFTWAQHLRQGAVVLSLVLAGQLVPVVTEGCVRVERPRHGQTTG